MNKKSGFYDIYKIQHSFERDHDQVTRKYEYEPRTKSVRRSFMDIVMIMIYRNRYSREQLLEGVADQGCAGEMKTIEKSLNQ